MILAALLACLAFIGLMELELAHRGISTTIVDSAHLWAGQRARASQLGEKALVLVGASRMQLDADLEVLRHRTGLEPVQLAIDGSSFVPILEGLFDDPSFRGTVIVGYGDQIIAGAGPDAIEIPASYQDAYADSVHRWLPDFRGAEAWLTDGWRGALRSYADGTRPITALRLRILLRAGGQYLEMLPDRSRIADYARVDLHQLMGNLLRRRGIAVPPDIDPMAHEAEILASIAKLAPDLAARAAFDAETRKLTEGARKLRARGGQVYFVVLPKSGFVAAVEERKYPRALFWDRFAAAIDAPALHFDDVPAMRAFVCPDGSHLDYRQRDAFTMALSAALALEGQRWRTKRKH